MCFIINAFSTIQYTKLSKELNFKKEFLVYLPSLIISGIIGITLALKKYGVWSLVFSSLSQSIFVTIQLWIRSDWKPKIEFNKNAFVKHFKYGYKLTLSGFLETIFSNFYVIVIGKFFNTSQVGFYNRADSLKTVSNKQYNINIK